MNLNKIQYKIVGENVIFESDNNFNCFYIYREKEEIEYAKQALIACKNTLMINSLSENPDCYGGCFYFKDGQIKEKLDYNIEGILIIEK